MGCSPTKESVVPFTASRESVRSHTSTKKQNNGVKSPPPQNKTENSLPGRAAVTPEPEKSAGKRGSYSEDPPKENGQLKKEDSAESLNIKENDVVVVPVATREENDSISRQSDRSDEKQHLDNKEDNGMEHHNEPNGEVEQRDSQDQENNGVEQDNVHNAEVVPMDSNSDKSDSAVGSAVSVEADKESVQTLEDNDDEINVDSAITGTDTLNLNDDEDAESLMADETRSISYSSNSSNHENALKLASETESMSSSTKLEVEAVAAAVTATVVQNSVKLFEEASKQDEQDDDERIADDNDNIVSDQTELPALPPNERPGNLSCLYGNSRGKWPIRNYCKTGLHVDANYGGCASLILCSCSYGGKGEETSAEIFLVRSGFDCYHYSISSIIKGNSGHFGAENYFQTDDDGFFLGNLMFGNNVVMLLANDSKNGKIDNGLLFYGPTDKEDAQPLGVNVSGGTPQLPGCSNVIVLCSGSEAGMDSPKISNAVYFIRTGFKDKFIQTKIIHGDDIWKFSESDGILQVTGVGNSRYTMFCNKADRVVSESAKPQVVFTQATTGVQATNIWSDTAGHGTLLILCSNSQGRENCTLAALYVIVVKDGEITASLVKENLGDGYKGSDFWKFEVVGGKSISVTGPAGPCRYAVLSNMEEKESVEKFQQNLCLATGDPHSLRGRVVIEDKMVSGIVDQPTKISIEVNHNTVAIFKPEQLKKIGDGWAFCRAWKDGEIQTGNSIIRVQAVKMHVTDKKEVFIPLSGSPKRLIKQKEGVVYAVNCGGPVYTSIDDVTYLSEHSLYANFSYDFNCGSRHKTYGKPYTKTNVPALLNKTHDGFIYSTMRVPGTEAIDEQKAHFDAEVPNGKYTLRLHFMDRFSQSYMVNGTDVTPQIKVASNAQKDLLPEHKSYTAYIAEIPVNITEGKLSIRSAKVASCAFALLDADKYKQKTFSQEYIVNETKEKQGLMDTTPPLIRSITRKELEIVGWSQNLLMNPSAESGSMAHWNTSGTWNVIEGGHGTEKAMNTSHMRCTKYQEINLLEHFSAEYLDTAPSIQVTEWYKEGSCGGGYYSLDVSLMDQNGKKIKEFSTGKIGRIYKNQQWTEATHTFEHYGPGARMVGFQSYGQDDKHWAGSYGAVMSGAEVRVKRETKPAPKDSFTDIELSMADGFEFSSKRDQLVSQVLKDNQQLMIELIEDDVLDKNYTEQTYVGKKKRIPRKFRKREIRVFVSSTFRDFTMEREELIKKTFREINRMCTDRGVFFTYVDLRWGITVEQTKTGQTIAICLQEIERCRPYFLCMLGQRFGWCQKDGEVDKALNQSFDYAIENYPSLKWIENYRYNTSVTQLEVLHGVLNDIQTRKDRSFFYLRSPPDKEKMETTEFERRTAESEWHSERQTALREKIEKTEELNIRNFTDPEEVCIQIKEDLEWAVNQDFPLGTELSPLEREREAHQAFADARCQVYIGREEYFEEIDKMMDKGLKHPFVLLGESGSGKSALVANWVKRARQKHPEAFVYVHFIGSSAESASYLKMLRRLYEEIKSTFSIDMPIPTSDINLILDVGKWVRMAASDTKQKVIIVFDALNQLNEGTGEDGSEHDLQWVPRDIPENVFVLMSTLPGRAMDVIRNAGWETMKVDPLDGEQKREIIVGYLEGIYGKTLNEEQKQMIIDAPQTNNPLYLRSLLDEVRIYGSFRTLTDKIKEYLLAGNPGDLFAKILERLEGDFDQDAEQAGIVENFTMRTMKLVRDTTTAIWCSHRGMSEGELTELLGVPSAVWSPFYLSLVENLVNRNGIVNFFHDHLRQAVEKKYLGNGEEKRKTFKILADFFSSKELDDRVVDELPFLLANAGELDKLRETISNLEVFRRLVKTEEGKFDLMKSWQLLGDYTQAEAAYLSKLKDIPAEETVTEDYTLLLGDLGDFFIQIGLFNAAERVYERLVEVLETRYAVSHGTLVFVNDKYSWKYRCKHPLVINALHQLGHTCEKQMELNLAEKYFKDAVSRQNRVETPNQKLQLCEGLLGLASVMHLKNNMIESKKMLVRCLELSTDVLGKNHHYVAAILNKLGKLCYSQSRLDEAVGYFLQDLKLTRSDVGMAHPRIAAILSDVAMVYDDKNDHQAGELYETALAIMLDTYGNSHVDVAAIRFNLGSFYLATDYFSKAKYQFKEAHNVFLAFLGKDHPDTVAAQKAMEGI